MFQLSTTTQTKTPNLALPLFNLQTPLCLSHHSIPPLATVHSSVHFPNYQFPMKIRKSSREHSAKNGLWFSDVSTMGGANGLWFSDVSTMGGGQLWPRRVQKPIRKLSENHPKTIRKWKLIRKPSENPSENDSGSKKDPKTIRKRRMIRKQSENHPKTIAVQKTIQKPSEKR